MKTTNDKMVMRPGKVLVIALWFIVSNCSKQDQPAPQQETNILSYSIKNTSTQVSILSSQHSINIRFPDSIMNADNLIATFTLSQGCKATVKNIEQVSGISKNDYSNVFVYTVSVGGNSSDWTVTSTNNDYTNSLKLGNFLQQAAGNNCSYPWYMDQMYTGPYSYDNCGPASVSMACKWSDSSFTKTPEDARNAYRPEGGNWYPDDITFYLRDNDIPNSTIVLPATADGTMQTLKHQVDLHQLCILMLEMNSVRFTEDLNSHADRFYKTNPGIGHCIVVKGYKQVDNEMYFEVYDPNSFGAMYGTMYNVDSLKGKDRYYRYEDLFEATKTWWPKAFIVAKKGATVIE